MQAQIQDLTAQLVASQQQCADLQAAATSAASSRTHVTNTTRIHPHGPDEQQVMDIEAAEANKPQHAQQHRRQQHLRTADEAVRASQGSNASWRDALGLDSDSDAEQAPAGQMANNAGMVGSSNIGPARLQKPLGAGDLRSASHLPAHQTSGQSEGAGRAAAGLQLAVTSSSMHQQHLGQSQGAGSEAAGLQLAVTSSPMHQEALQPQRPLNPGTLVAMPEQDAMPNTLGQELVWPHSSGPMQRAVRLFYGRRGVALNARHHDHNC